MVHRHQCRQNTPRHKKKNHLEKRRKVARVRGVRATAGRAGLAVRESRLPPERMDQYGPFCLLVWLKGEEPHFGEGVLWPPVG